MNELLKGSISFGVALYNTYQPSPSSNGSNTPLIPGSPIRGHTPRSGSGNLKFTDHARNLSTPSGFSKISLDNSSDDWRKRGLDLSIRLRKMRREIISPDCWKLSIPAILYVIQNNLQFVAASNLDVATFQVSYQMKILTTALFSVLMLKRRLSISKWLSLLFLAIGVGIVQIQTAAPKTASSHSDADPTTGFLAVAAACMTSGLAGVYFEMVLKGSTTDLWIRNVQLSIFSLIPALVPTVFASLPIFASFQSAKPAASLFTDGGHAGGFLLPGFGFWAWATVLCQVLGGLVTALVIKFSDNIMKGFATSLSIVLSFLAGVVLFNFQITSSFVVGCSVVLGATYYYNKPSPTSTGISLSNGSLPSSIVKMSEKDEYRSTVNSAVKSNFDSPERFLQRRQYDASSPTTQSFAEHPSLMASVTDYGSDIESPLLARMVKREQSPGVLGKPTQLRPEDVNVPMARTPSGSFLAGLAGLSNSQSSEADEAEKGHL